MSHIIPKAYSIGRGNMICTIWTNFKTVCNVMNRPIDHFRKFVRCELGTITTYEESDGSLRIRGYFRLTVLQNIIFKYENKYVKCKHCKSFDTDLSASNDLSCNNCHKTYHVI